jgi:hypothetical protein
MEDLDFSFMGKKTKRERLQITAQIDSFILEGQVNVVAVRIDTQPVSVYLELPELRAQDLLNVRYPARVNLQTWFEYIRRTDKPIVDVYRSLYNPVFISKDMLRELCHNYKILFLVTGESKQVVERYTNLCIDFEVKERTLQEIAMGKIEGYSKSELNEIKQKVESIRDRIEDLIHIYGEQVLDHKLFQYVISRYIK